MIRSFRRRETKRIWEGQISLKLPRDIQDRALRKLRQLDAALVLDDLKNPPSNHLETLKGNNKGRMSVRVNDQWRICFRWNDGEVTAIEIIDYH